MSRPSGNPISLAFDTSNEPFEGVINNTLSWIDSVHGDGSLPSIVAITGDAGNAESTIFTNPETGTPIAIMIHFDTEQPHFSFLHELGHFLDNQGIDSPGRYASESSPILAQWRESVHGTESVQHLRNIVNRANDPPHPSGASSEIVTEIAIDIDYVKYLLKPRELFARSYAQYVIRRNMDVIHKHIGGIILRELDDLRRQHVHRIYPIQWEDDDFEPIALTLDRLFRDLGWIQ
jgi:hypothetical protein